MFSLPLAFTTPIVLTGLALLAGIWFLLRLVPPRPKEVTFPPTRLLLDSPNREETPARTPWWLTLLRLLLAALIIIALAGPIWRPLDAGTAADGPLAVVVDNGWASASHWEEVVFTAGGLIEAAENRNRSVALIATADGQAQTFEPVSAADARDRLRALEPRPWPADRGSLAAGFGEVSDLVGEVIWLADGIAGQNDSGFLQALSQLPEGVPIAVYEPGGSGAMALVETANDADRLTARVVRAAPGPAQSGALSAVDERGRPIGSASFAFAADETAAEASFELPIELRNQIARLELTEKADAGSVFFLDERWRRRTVGLLAGSGFDAAQPLLSPIHYLSQALVPFADVRIPRETEIGSASKELIDRMSPSSCWPISARLSATAPSNCSPGSKTAACWCGLPVRGLPRARPVFCRFGCAAVNARSAETCPGRSRNRSANSPKERRLPGL
ncbi:MAG: BatA domain-containing protein [Pseudomonadota bacterium]